MPSVKCQHIDCIYCDISGDFECKAPAITIGNDWNEGCDSYKDYRDQPDYQNEYWIAVKIKSGELARTKMYRGKQIEYKGMVFYTKYRIEAPRYCLLIDAETGFGVGPLSTLAERFDTICEQAAKYPKVKTLPEAEWRSGGYELMKEKRCENG